MNKNSKERRPSRAIGIRIEGSSKVDIVANRFEGLDEAIVAINSSDVIIDRNVISSGALETFRDLRACLDDIEAAVTRLAEMPDSAPDLSRERSRLLEKVAPFTTAAAGSIELVNALVKIITGSP